MHQRTEANKFMMEMLKSMPMVDQNSNNMLQGNQQQTPEMAVR